jgi:hypothetical protein
MFNYELSKENTNAKIKAAAKADLTAMFMDFLKEKFGDENVSMIRTGGMTKTNEIGVRVGTVDINGEPADLVATFNPTIKEFENRQTAKKTYTAFDFESAATDYENYLEEKQMKAVAAKELKEKNIARDTAKRKKKEEEEEE